MSAAPLGCAWKDQVEVPLDQDAIVVQYRDTLAMAATVSILSFPDGFDRQISAIRPGFPGWPSRQEKRTSVTSDIG